MREITGTGWLSPDGEFVPCDSYEHISTSKRILSELGKEIPPARSPIYAEELLRSMGWISITFKRYRDFGYDFIFDHRIGHSDIQTRMIESFAEGIDLASTGKFHLCVLLGK